MLSDRVLGGLFEVAVSRGECVDVLLVVAESYWPRSWSPTVESVGSGELQSRDSGGRGDSPTRGEPAPPPPTGRSGFCRLVVEKFMLPASPVSRGCRILLSRTCCRRSASRLGLPRLRMRDLRCFSGEGGDEDEGGMSFAADAGAGLRWEPMPSRRKILRFRPPSGRSGIRLVSGGERESATWIQGRTNGGSTLDGPGGVSPGHGMHSSATAGDKGAARRGPRRTQRQRRCCGEGTRPWRSCCCWRTIRCR